MSVHIYLVSYDIVDDRVRSRVSRILMEYGNRVQKSVFELAFKKHRELEKLKEQLADELGEEENVRFYRICQSCREHSHQLNGDPVATFPAVVVL